MGLEFPNCKFKRNTGTLLVTSTQLIFVTRFLGRANKTLFSCGDIKSIAADGNMLLVVFKSTLPRKFTMATASVAKTAQQLIEGIVRENFPRDVGVSEGQEEIHPMRVEVVFEFEARHREELSLVDHHQSLIVTRTRPAANGKDEMYFGQSANGSGWFPQKKVALIEETSFVQQLLKCGFTLQFDLLTKGEWRWIVEQSSHTETYAKHQVVVPSFNFEQRLFHVLTGSCTMGPRHYREGDLFGIEGLIVGGCTLHNVIAEEENTSICILEPTKLKKLFTRFPSLGGRFYKLLGMLLDHRIYLHCAHPSDRCCST